MTNRHWLEITEYISLAASVQNDNDIEQGKREIEESVKKLGESLNNLFKP